MHSDKLNSLEKRTAVSLASVFAIRMLGLFMLMPIMAIYGQSLEGVSPLWIGLAIGAYGLTQAIFQIPMGWLSDRYGRKKIIVIGLLIFALGSVIAGMATDIVWVTVGRAIQGMGAIASAVLALASDVTREEQRPKVMAVIGMCIGLSFSIALVLGPMIAERFGLSGVFFITAILALVGILIVFTIVPSSYTTARSSEVTAAPDQIGTMLLNKQLLRLDFGVFTLHLMMTSMFIVVPVLFMEQGFNISDHWTVYLPVLLLSFVVMVPMIIAGAKKSKEKTFFLLSIALLLLSSIGMILNTSFNVLVFMLFIFFIGFNFLEASLPAHVSRLAPAGQKGTAMGIYSSSQFLGAFFGGITGGYVAETFGVSYLFASNAALAVLWFAFAKGMILPISSKRVSIAFDMEKQTERQSIIDQICQCTGVLEATLVEDEHRIYLKVDKQSFNRKDVDQLVNNFN